MSWYSCFSLLLSLGIQISSFTQADLTSGSVQYVHSGEPGKHSDVFSFVLSDGVHEEVRGLAVHPRVGFDPWSSSLRVMGRQTGDMRSLCSSVLSHRTEAGPNSHGLEPRRVHVRVPLESAGTRVEERMVLGKGTPPTCYCFR